MALDLAAIGADHFAWRGGELFCEETRLADLAARFGTPLYVYSRAAIAARVGVVRAAFGPDAHIAYAVKSNGNLSLLRLLAELGVGFDLVSGGELHRLVRAGVPTRGAVFAGVGKEEWEICAAQQAGILFFVVESMFELDVFERVAADLGPVPLALRLNPAVQADTHRYIHTGGRGDKFGLDPAAAAAVVERILRNPRLSLVGYHVHLGSQLLDAAPYLAAWRAVESFLDADPRRAAGVRYYDLGGGFGVPYGSGARPLDVAALAREMLPRLARRGLTPVVEPGRYLIADAGVLLTRVLGLKEQGAHGFAVVDAAMNDLLRPALYQAEHPIAPVRPRSGALREIDVVGPVCESSDFLAKQRALPELAAGDLLSVFGAGAYGSSMASNYNSRRRPAEVLVTGTTATLIRRREELEDLWRAEVEL